MREFRSFFSSPIGWTIGAVFSLIAGIVFVGLLIRYRQAGLSLAQSGQLRTGVVGLHYNDWVVRPYFTNLASILLFFIPVLTMRSFAEERRSGSLDVLLSLPVHGSDLILGKFAGAALTLCALLLVVPLHGIISAIVSVPDWGAAIVATFGLLLLGLFMLSLGILISSLSGSQVEAAVLTLGLLLLLGLGPSVTEATSPAVARLLRSVAVLARYEDFARGIFDLKHVVFYCGGTLIALAMALRSLDLLRWRGV
jgi:ABC-2 type transport system permease protein